MTEEPFGRSRLSEELESLRKHAQAALDVPVVWTSIAELTVGDEVVERLDAGERGVRWQKMCVARVSGHRIDDHFALMLLDPKGREELYGCWGTDPVLVIKAGPVSHG